MTRTKFYLNPTKLHTVIKGKNTNKETSKQEFQNWIWKKVNSI